MTNEKECIAKRQSQLDGEGIAFFVGEQVEKVGGDYTFVGEVVAVFVKKSNAIRYVVEDDRGVLHIYSAKNLRKKV